jgi:hypothetical protein
VLDWVAIHQQVADECLSRAEAELQKKEGADFDHCYIGGQIMAHMKVLAELKVVQNYVSVEMKKDLSESMRMTENHLELAKEDCRKCERRGRNQTRFTQTQSGISDLKAIDGTMKTSTRLECWPNLHAFTFGLPGKNAAIAAPATDHSRMVQSRSSRMNGQGK